MPVWPICFWIRWPMPLAASMRFPAPSTSRSWTVTAPSSSAAMDASAARSITSLSRYRPNFVIAAPMIHTSLSATLGLLVLRPASGRLVGEADRLGPIVVRPGSEGGQPDRHADPDLVGVG